MVTRHRQQVVAFDQLGDLLAVGVGVHRVRGRNHHILEPGARPSEDEIPERHHSGELLAVVGHVDVAEVGAELVVEPPQRLDRLARVSPPGRRRPRSS